MPASELPTNEIHDRLVKVVHLLRGFEKRAYLKTRSGNESAQEIEVAAMDFEKVLTSLELGDQSQVMGKLSKLEQRVEVLQKTIERMKRMVT